MVCTAPTVIHSDLTDAFTADAVPTRTLVASSPASVCTAKDPDDGSHGNVGGSASPTSSAQMDFSFPRTDAASVPLIQFLVETPHGRTTTVSRSFDSLLSRLVRRRQQMLLWQHRHRQFHPMQHIQHAHQQAVDLAQRMDDTDDDGDDDDDDDDNDTQVSDSSSYFRALSATREDQEADYHDLLMDVLRACQTRDAPQTSSSFSGIAEGDATVTIGRCCSPAVNLDSLTLDDSCCSASTASTANSSVTAYSAPASVSSFHRHSHSEHYMDIDEYIFDEPHDDHCHGSSGINTAANNTLGTPFFVPPTGTSPSDRPLYHRASPKKRRRRRVLAARDPRIALVWDGQRVNPDNYYHMIQKTVLQAISSAASSTANAKPSVLVVPLRLAVGLIVGGIDRQNRVGSKFGGGGVSSTAQSDRERKERLKQLALESIDLAKDPYLMRNHLGTYECKLCLTLHTNEANYLAHTQGKKHQQGLARRAHFEKLRQEKESNSAVPTTEPSPASSASSRSNKKQRIKIGRPAYQVFKSRDPDTNQRCLTFEIDYPEIADDVQPRHRFMSAYEQKVETPPDRRYQYLVFAAEPYETVAFKVPNEPLDRNKFMSHWKDNKFTVSMYYWDKPDGSKKDRTKDGSAEKNGEEAKKNNAER